MAIIYESPEKLIGGQTLTVGAVRKALDGLPDDALFYTSTERDDKGNIILGTKIFVLDKTPIV